MTSLLLAPFKMTLDIYFRTLYQLKTKNLDVKGQKIIYHLINPKKGTHCLKMNKQLKQKSTQIRTNQKCVPFWPLTLTKFNE